MAEKKFYWLKLKEDFFRQKEIKKLRKIAGGDTFTIIYLKMQLLSLRNEGILYYEGTEDTFEEQLSLEIDEDMDNVKVTLAFLFNNNLIEEISENEFFLNKASECIGKEGSSARRVRKLREKQAIKQIEGQTTLQCNANVTEGNKNVTTEIERRDREKRKEIDIEKETEIDNKSSVVVSNIEVFKRLEKCGIVITTRLDGKQYSRLLELIEADIEIYGPQWVMDAADLAVTRGKYNLGYVEGILRNWKAEGRKEDLDGATSKPTKNTESEPQYKFDF